ncbi:DUF2938 domain-containing protein [Gilvimarinus sp. DA14]|uniref:DUF2938 domain-containing protein n=1 Tax=Gilvimarinus sp. DA14 TaxID=2956798 RepID=UPI0020B7F0B0|nr:DUF2938 domain-containing protein [Gilvimarinus sp. DA14]UTF61451.1 DUF2938 domain-containing protein [Gilvimarinus sp. DA14]
MKSISEWVLAAVLLGVSATALLDCWAWLQRWAFNTPSMNMRYLGRWLGHVSAGRVFHRAIAQSSPVVAELWLGWVFHYITGVVFALVFLGWVGNAWLFQPNLWPALGFGVATVLLPFLFMQPGMGQGIAASRTAAPWTARLKSLLNHAIFGVGLYLAGIVWFSGG